MIRKTLLIISLLLLAGTVGLWVRIYWACTRVCFHSTQTNLSQGWLCDSGRICVWIATDRVFDVGTGSLVSYD